MKKKKNPPKKHFGFTQLYDALNLQMVPVWTLSAQECATPNEMPSHISILGQRYRIKYRRLIYSAPKKSARLHGIVIFSNRLIVIDPDQGIHRMRETLYHETCHVYFKECQAKDGRLHKVSDQAIEGFCDLFGEAIVDLAVNNTLPR